MNSPTRLFRKIAKVPIAAVTLLLQFYKATLVSETFTVDQAVNALGFGKFQLKLSLLTGLAWVSCTSTIALCRQLCANADGRCNGNDDSVDFSACAALRMVVEQLGTSLVDDSSLHGYDALVDYVGQYL